MFVFFLDECTIKRFTFFIHIEGLQIRKSSHQIDRSVLNPFEGNVFFFPLDECTMGCQIPFYSSIHIVGLEKGEKSPPN
jgi:hypothetical protein